MKKHCQWCDAGFQPTTRNQVYCSVDCRKKAQRQKIDERCQSLKVTNRVGKVRKCAGGCGSQLSIYNDRTFCDSCEMDTKKYSKLLKEILDFGKANG
jgi:hypothetical protein